MEFILGAIITSLIGFIIPPAVRGIARSSKNPLNKVELRKSRRTFYYSLAAALLFLILAFHLDGAIAEIFRVEDIFASLFLLFFSGAFLSIVVIAFEEVYKFKNNEVENDTNIKSDDA